MLNLDLCWEHGQFRWYDPVSERYLLTHDAEAEGRIAAEAERDAERRARMAAEADVADHKRASGSWRRSCADDRCRLASAADRKLRGTAGCLSSSDGFGKG